MLKKIKQVLAGPWVPAKHGKAPYLWTFCLTFMLFKYVNGLPSAQEAAWLLLTMLVFVPAYFMSYWPAPPGSKVALILFACLIGTLWAPYNSGAGTFFIYACGMCAGIQPVKRAYWMLAVIQLLAVAASSLTPLWPWGITLPTMLIGLPVGISGIMDAQVMRANASLLRKQEEVEHMATIAERERISRDLHDLLGHTLSLITLKAELAGKLVTRDAAAAQKEIKDIEQCARSALSEVRSAVTGYRQTGFAHELDTARASLAAANVALEASVQSFTLPPAAENVMSLALREAVTNIVRHAQAKRCEVSLALEHGSIVFRIADDGVVLKDASAIRRGNGLNGMSERVSALGGHLAVRVERGLALELTLPMGVAA